MDPDAGLAKGHRLAIGTGGPKAKPLREGIQRQGAVQGALGVIGLGDRGSEQDHDAIPQILIDGPPMGDDELGHALQVTAEDVDQGPGGEAFRGGGKARDVREQHGDLPALAAQSQQLGIGHQLLDPIGVQITGEGAVYELLLAALLATDEGVGPAGRGEQGHGGTRQGQQGPTPVVPPEAQRPVGQQEA